MSLFSCCPKKPKKSLDYIIKWVEDTDKTIKDLSNAVKELNTWKEDISEETLRRIFDEYAETYPWDNVPAFNAKADKVVNATAGNLASLDSEGNLQDSGKKTTDFAPASGSTEYAAADHNHAGVYSPVDHNHDSAYAQASHTHSSYTVNGLNDFIRNVTARLEALEGQQTTSWTTLATISWPNTKYGNDSLYNFDEVEQLKVGQKIRLIIHNTPTTVAVECSVIYTGGIPYIAETNADLSAISANAYDIQVASFS